MERILMRIVTEAMLLIVVIFTGVTLWPDVRSRIVDRSEFTPTDTAPRPYVRFTDPWKEAGLYEQEARNPSYDFSARFDAYAVLQSCIVAALAVNGDRYPDQALDRDTAKALHDELLRDQTPEDILGEDASVRKALLHINDLCGFIIHLAGQREEAATRRDPPQSSVTPTSSQE